MKRKEWLPVRCCCTPQKVFGFLSVETGADTVVDRAGRSHLIEIRTFSSCAIRSYEARLHTDVSASIPVMAAEHAIYSDDRPIEFWRSIKGFVETKDEN